jgi:curved DNA-binding protein CbpA
MRTFYDVLECHPAASAEVLRAAYRAQSKRYHPDMPGGDRARFQEVQEAWNVLGDPGRRATYDKALHTPPSADRIDIGGPPPPVDDTIDRIVGFGFGLAAEKLGRERAEAGLDLLDAITRLRKR